MDKLDFKQLFKSYYSPKPGRPEIITMPKMQFVMVDGTGMPETSQSFQDAIGALYGTVYGLKFGRKKAGLQPDFTIGPLEGLWWTKSGKFDSKNPKDWFWTLMIWLPDFIKQKDVDQRVAELKVQKPNPALDGLRLGKLEEKEVVQLMHVGPYDAEGPNIELMLRYAQQQGYQLRDKHHEIYLGDPRRAKPEKLKTILRHPVSRVAKKE